MNHEIEILKLSGANGYFSVLIPHLENEKANKVLRKIESCLIINGYRKFSQPAWCEIKQNDIWFTKFLFKIPESKPEPGIKRAIESALNQALKEVANRC